MPWQPGIIVFQVHADLALVAISFIVCHASMDVTQHIISGVFGWVLVDKACFQVFVNCR